MHCPKIEGASGLILFNKCVTDHPHIFSTVKVKVWWPKIKYVMLQILTHCNVMIKCLKTKCIFSCATVYTHVTWKVSTVGSYLFIYSIFWVKVRVII